MKRGYVYFQVLTNSFLLDRKWLNLSLPPRSCESATSDSFDTSLIGKSLLAKVLLPKPDSDPENQSRREHSVASSTEGQDPLYLISL